MNWYQRYKKAAASILGTIPDEVKKQVIDLYAMGTLSVNEISRRTNLNPYLVNRIIQEGGIAKRQNRKELPQGMDIKAIADEYESGLATKWLAQYHQIPYSILLRELTKEMQIRGKPMRDQADYMDTLGRYSTERLKKLWQDPEYKTKMQDMSKTLWQDPEYYNMQVEKSKKRWEGVDFKTWLSQFPPEKQTQIMNAINNKDKQKTMQPANSPSPVI